VYFEITVAIISSMQFMVQFKEVLTGEVITAYNNLIGSGMLNWLCDLLQQK
jgi:hypothetical protein